MSAPVVLILCDGDHGWLRILRLNGLRHLLDNLRCKGLSLWVLADDHFTALDIGDQVCIIDLTLVLGL